MSKQDAMERGQGQELRFNDYSKGWLTIRDGDVWMGMPDGEQVFVREATADDYVQAQSQEPEQAEPPAPAHGEQAPAERWRSMGVADGVRFGQEGNVAVRGEVRPGAEIRSLQGMCELANDLAAALAAERQQREQDEAKLERAKADMSDALRRLNNTIDRKNEYHRLYDAEHDRAEQAERERVQWWKQWVTESDLRRVDQVRAGKAEAEVARLREWIAGRHILPTGRCTECGIIAGHQPGCDVAVVLGGS